MRLGTKRSWYSACGPAGWQGSAGREQKPGRRQNLCKELGPLAALFSLTADTLRSQQGRPMPTASLDEPWTEGCSTAGAHHGFAGDAQRLLAAQELVHLHFLVLILLVVLKEPGSPGGRQGARRLETLGT